MQQRLVRGVMAAVMGPFFRILRHFSRSSSCPGVERQFFELSSAHSCECSRAPAGVPISNSDVVDIHAFRESSEQQQQQQSYNLERLRLSSEEPPPHSGELKHALAQAGAQPNPSCPALCRQGHHISMEHRLRRKQLNFDTNASIKKYSKEIQEKRKEQNFLRKK